MDKAQEKSIKTIIIGALTLSILLVLMIFSYDGSFLSGSTTVNKQSCSTMEGVCRVLIQETPNLGCEEGEFPNEENLCGPNQTGKESVCCMKTGLP